MKARLSLSNRIPKKQQKILDEFVKEQFRSEGHDYTRRLLKIVCIALNETEGFGKLRLGKLLNAVTEISNEHMNDEVFWVHADKRLEQIGLPFEQEDYERMEKQ